MKVDKKLTNPEYFLFAYKTGCNTFMKKDGHITGTRYITQQGTQAQQMVSTSEGRFTVIPLIAANGLPVCCVVISKSNHPKQQLEWGK